MYILMLISLAVILISCDGKKEGIVEPIYHGEGWGENIEVSASYVINLGDDFVFSIDSASQLFSINSPDINQYGTSNNWISRYLSSDFSKVYVITFESGGDWMAIGLDTTGNAQVGGSIISTDWIDSDLAMELAEKNGGYDFRNENVDYKISASLSEAVVPNSFPIWNIFYYNSIESLTIRINSTNGEIIRNY